MFYHVLPCFTMFYLCILDNVPPFLDVGGQVVIKNSSRDVVFLIKNGNLSKLKGSPWWSFWDAPFHTISLDKSPFSLVKSQFSMDKSPFSYNFLWINHTFPSTVGRFDVSVAQRRIPNKRNAEKGSVGPGISQAYPLVNAYSLLLEMAYRNSWFTPIKNCDFP